MRVQVFGANYEGAHFRGIPSDTDDTPLVVVLEGSEKNIVRYISENFSYGVDEDAVPRFDVYVDHIKNGTEPMFDGCGGVVKIVNEAGDVLFDTISDSGFEDNTKWLDLGVVNVDEIEDPFDHINNLVEEK